LSENPALTVEGTKMTPERWQQIDNLLQRVVDIGAAERTALLDELCTGDEDLRQEVESLISFQEMAQSFLEVPALEEAADLLSEDEAGSVGELVLGRYRIEAQLGAGGMGEVYLAEDTNLDSKVAIKFLPSYLEADELAKRRLILEAKATAQLDHPNICRVYKVKEDANRSFIVMQYVDGKTLADRIKDKPLDLREALDVGMQIVEALAEAHSHGIVHRDIKPRNVMINTRGQVKVLDFGLVKVVGGTISQRIVDKRSGLLSRPGQRAGTPPYMSPEQACGAAIDARCDLFAVGVILYECLSGRRPFSGDTDKKILAQVRHLNPPPPSQFNPHVPPELDHAILKALAKERDARYQSANDLLGDLRAIYATLQAQDQVPTKPLPGNLDTRGVSTLRTITSTLRRPAVSIPSVGAAIVVLVWIFWSPPTIPPPSPAAMHWYEEGTAALREGTYHKASKALEQAIQTDDKFALAHARLAEAYAELDYADKAKDQVIRAESLANELRMRPLDALYLQAITKTVLRDFAPAIGTYRQIAQQAPDKDKAHVYMDLGRAYEKNDQLKEAGENYLEATKLAPQDAAALLRLGALCSQQQDFTCAVEAFQKAEALYQAQSNLEGVAEVFYQRGFLFLNQDKPAAARAELERVLQITKATANEYQQIKALLALSSVSAIEGHTVQAEQQATEAIELARTNGVENQSTSGLIWLGNSFLLRGDYNDAEKYYQRALELAQRDKLRLNEAWARLQLGSLRISEHKTDEGLRYIDQALPFYRQGGYRKWLSTALTLRGRALRDKGDYDGALKAFNDQLKLGEQLGDPSQVALTHEEIGSVLSDQEQYPEALRHFDESHKTNSSLKAPVYVAYSAMHRASVLWQIGRYEEARAALQEASSIAETPDGTNKLLLATIRMIDALMELSELHNQQAGVKSHQALNLAGTQYKVTAIQARYVLGLAQSRSGATRAGRQLCEAAIDMATQTGDQHLVSTALLAKAEVMLDGGDPQPALQTALRAQESFARFGQKDSEWRAWLIAALASQRLGKEPVMREYASNARARLTNLEQEWGAEAYRGYLSRQDVQRSLKQLELLLKQQP
jgi:serine/threonine protein kinase/Tfp pilus assembly protein PilF